MTAEEQQAVIIVLKLSDDDFGSFEERESLFDLEERVRSAIQPQGEYDGHELGRGWARLYLYGPDCRRLSELVTPILRDFGPLPESYLLERPGPPGTPESARRL